MTRFFPGFALTGFLIAALTLFARQMHADTIWTDWTNVTLGLSGGGTAAGSAGGVNVSYFGELVGDSITGLSPIWSPAGTFAGGTVTVAPSVVGDDLRLNGTFSGTNTVTFSSPVEDPLLAIWSLGAPSSAASFTFSEAPTLEAGGPNSAFHGSSITVSGKVVSGKEGNGVVQFTGDFNSLSWTDTFENYYAFTVGINGFGEQGSAAVPEPSSGALFVITLGLTALVLRRKSLLVPKLQREAARRKNARRSIRRERGT